jgi:hypothetical protein
MKQKDQLQSCLASNESVEGLFKLQTLKQCKLLQLEKVLYSERKPVTGPMIIGEGTAFYN